MVHILGDFFFVGETYEACLALDALLQFLITYLMFFEVGVSCRILYSFVCYLYVSGSGTNTSVGEESANFSAIVYL